MRLSLTDRPPGVFFCERVHPSHKKDAFRVFQEKTNIINMKIINIIWDTDGQPVPGLPTEMLIPDETEVNRIADYLSDKTGWLVESFEIQEEKTIMKKTFIFSGSLSVLQIIEEKGIDKKVTANMSDQEAFETAQSVIRDHFEKEEDDGWDYDLTVESHPIEADDEETAYLEAEHIIDAFEHNNDFEDDDGSGNAQGYTAFTV